MFKSHCLYGNKDGSFVNININLTDKKSYLVQKTIYLLSNQPLMPKRYICRECKEIYSKKRECKICEDNTEEILFETSIWTLFPYIMAGVAGLFLLSAYLFNMPFLIWMTFPLIVVGILFDNYYQNKMDEKARDMIKE